MAGDWRICPSPTEASQERKAFRCCRTLLLLADGHIAHRCPTGRQLVRTTVVKPQGNSLWPDPAASRRHQYLSSRFATFSHNLRLHLYILKNGFHTHQPAEPIVSSIQSGAAVVLSILCIYIYMKNASYRATHIQPHFLTTMIFLSLLLFSEFPQNPCKVGTHSISGLS